MIKISRKTLEDLVSSKVKLQMLEAGGVDNWDWYGESLNPEGEESYYDFDEKISDLTDTELMELA